MAHQIHGGGPQSKAAILERNGLSAFVVSVPAAAAMIGLSENAALPLFQQRNVPILPMGPARRVVRLSDLERLLDELAKEAV